MAMFIHYVCSRKQEIRNSKKKKVWQLVQINVLAELARLMSKSDVLQFYSPNKYLIILTQLTH